MLCGTEFHPQILSALELVGEQEGEIRPCKPVAVGIDAGKLRVHRFPVNGQKMLGCFGFLGLARFGFFTATVFKTPPGFRR
jgi:hypothetical protein